MDEAAPPSSCIRAQRRLLPAERCFNRTSKVTLLCSLPLAAAATAAAATATMTATVMARMPLIEASSTRETSMMRWTAKLAAPAIAVGATAAATAVATAAAMPMQALMQAQLAANRSQAMPLLASAVALCWVQIYKSATSAARHDQALQGSVLASLPLLRCWAVRSRTCCGSRCRQCPSRRQGQARMCSGACSHCTQLRRLLLVLRLCRRCQLWQTPKPLSHR